MLKKEIIIDMSTPSSSSSYSNGTVTDMSIPSSSSSCNNHVSNPTPKRSNNIIVYSRRWAILAIFSLLSISNKTGLTSFSSMPIIVKEYYNVSVNWMQLLIFIFYVFVIASSYMLSRFGLRRVIIMGAILNAIGSFIRLGGRNRNGFVYIAIGNGFSALAQCFVLSVPATLGAAWFNDKGRAVATSIGVLSNILGSALGLLIGRVLVPKSKDYNGIVEKRLFVSLLSQAIACSLVAVATIIFMRNAPSSPPSYSQLLLLKARQKREEERDIMSNGNIATPMENVATTMQEKETSYVSFPPIEDHTENTNGEPKIPEINGFISSFQILFTDLSFHAILQVYGLSAASAISCNIAIDRWCTIAFPDKQETVTIMKLVGVIAGSISLPLTGVLIDKTHRYRLIYVSIMACSAVSLLIFTLLLTYNRNFHLVFVTFSIFEFFSLPSFWLGLEYAADVMFPVSEAITSSVLCLFANFYGLALAHILKTILEYGRVDVAGYAIVSLYLACTVIMMFMKGKLKRRDAEAMYAASMITSYGND